MTNINDEYKEQQLLYKKRYAQQKEYRQTPEGKLALRRAKERYLLKKMRDIPKTKGGGNSPFCMTCNESKFERLTVVEEEIILCYSCKFERPKILEIDDICQ